MREALALRSASLLRNVCRSRSSAASLAGSGPDVGGLGGALAAAPRSRPSGCRAAGRGGRRRCGWRRARRRSGRCRISPARWRCARPSRARPAGRQGPPPAAAGRPGRRPSPRPAPPRAWRAGPSAPAETPAAADLGIERLGLAGELGLRLAQRADRACHLLDAGAQAGAGARAERALEIREAPRQVADLLRRAPAAGRASSAAWRPARRWRPAPAARWRAAGGARAPHRCQGARPCRPPIGRTGGAGALRLRLGGLASGLAWDWRPRAVAAAGRAGGRRSRPSTSDAVRSMVA